MHLSYATQKGGHIIISLALFNICTSSEVTVWEFAEIAGGIQIAGFFTPTGRK